MTKMLSIADIFTSLGQPTVTYVEREAGRYENALLSGLAENGQLCLITGPSKTGKTTLYRRVLKTLNLEPIIIRCNDKLTADDFWKQPLESLDFGRIAESESAKARTLSGKLGVKAKIGWKWLGELTGQIGAETDSTISESQIRQYVLAKPSPRHLIPLLKYLPYVLIVEDFHYLKEDVQKSIFQQWKEFTDNEVSVIVLGTTHHAVDIAHANKDLIGRLCQIDISTWSDDDLKKIVENGFNYLSVSLDEEIIDLIAKESAGLPIITQQVCHQLFKDKGITKINRGGTIGIVDKITTKFALHNLASTKYLQLEDYYNDLITGPRKRARKYNTYELVLTCFTLSPTKFSLQRHEIDQRLRDLPIEAVALPPAASINSTLSALGKFQNSRSMELLEWSDKRKTLYITEPSFLFYLRWRTQNLIFSSGERQSIAELLASLFQWHDSKVLSTNIAPLTRLNMPDLRIKLKLKGGAEEADGDSGE